MLWFQQENVVSTGEMQYYAGSRVPYGPSVRGTIRVHQMHYLLSKSWLGVPSHSIWPPVPVTKTPSSNCTPPVPAHSALAVTLKVGEVVMSGSTSWTKAWHSSALTEIAEKSAVPEVSWKRAWESDWFRFLRSLRMAHYLEIHKAVQWKDKPLNVWPGVSGFSRVLGTLQWEDLVQLQMEIFFISLGTHLIG